MVSNLYQLVVVDRITSGAPTLPEALLLREFGIHAWASVACATVVVDAVRIVFTPQTLHDRIKKQEIDSGKPASVAINEDPRSR